jgi:hypothetical protein
MTKQELLALAMSNDVRIKIDHTVTRYRVAPASRDADGGRSDAAIYFTFTDDNGSCHDDAYFVDDRGKQVPLTREETDSLADTVYAWPV